MLDHPHLQYGELHFCLLHHISCSSSSPQTVLHSLIYKHPTQWRTQDFSEGEGGGCVPFVWQHAANTLSLIINGYKLVLAEGAQAPGAPSLDTPLHLTQLSFPGLLSTFSWCGIGDAHRARINLTRLLVTC